MKQQMRVPVQAFNLKDLQTGQIAYQPHPRAKPGPDSVLLQATDNYSVLTMLMDIDIRTKVWQSDQRWYLMQNVPKGKNLKTI